MVWYNKYEYLQHNFSLWNNKKKINRIMKKLKFYEFFDVHMDKILSTWEYYVQSTEVVVRSCSIKKVFLEILQNSQENTCARVSFLINLQAEACNFIKKETLALVFSCEFRKISKNTFSYRTPPLSASESRADFSWTKIMADQFYK